MWTNRVLMCGIDILLCLWAVYLFFFYFDIFFVRKRKRYLSVIGITLFVIWQFGITTIISFPAYINIAVTIMFTFLAVMMTYEGRWWNKGVFVITFNAIWMLMETLCSYILITCTRFLIVANIIWRISQKFNQNIKLLLTLSCLYIFFSLYPTLINVSIISCPIFFRIFHTTCSTVLYGI